MTELSEPERGETGAIRIRLDGKALFLILAIVLVILGGVALRVHSLAYTPYPYLLDGLGEAQYAEYIAETGSITPDPGASYSETHTVSTPAYDVLIASFSLVQGEQPLFLLQKLLAPFSVLMLVGVYALARRFSGSQKVSIFALMALSAYGPFLMITQSTWKECIGISLIPLIFLTFAMRADRRMRTISIVLILFIPFVHHMIAIIVILAIGFSSFADFLIARKAKKLRTGNIIDALVTIVAIDEMALYYSIVKFDRLEYLTPQNGLYLFFGLAALIAVGVYYWADKGLTKGGKKTMVAVTSISFVALLAMNLIAPLGTADFSAVWVFSIPALACVLIVFAGIIGISIWGATASRFKTYYLALIAAPLVLVIHGLLRGEDVISLDMITRSIDILDLGVMIAAGTFIIYLVRNRSKIVTTAVISVACVLIILTMPIAFDSEKYAATRNDIYSYEVDGINWTASMARKGEIQTDVLWTYTSYLFNKLDDGTLVRRIVGTLDLEPGEWMIASEKWVIDGVKDLPFGWIKIDPTVFNSTVDKCNSLYVGGPPDEQIVIFRVP